MRQYKDLGKEIFSAFTNSYEDDEPIYFDTDNISAYERIDEQITSTTYCNGADVEIKVRRIPVNKYSTSMLEVDKYNELMNYSNNKGKIYFVVYPYDNLIYWFDLSNTNKEDMEKLIEKGHNRAMSADFAKLYKKKVKATDTYGLPFSMGYAYKFDCSRWIDRIDELSKKQSRIKK